MQRKKYILVEWPYSQIYMEHPRFYECYLRQGLIFQEFGDPAYFVPEDIYNELKNEVE